MLGLLEGAVQEGLEVALDGGEGGAELVGDVGHELRAHLLEAAELRDVVEDDDHPGLVAREAEGDGMHLQDALRGVGQFDLPAHHLAVGRGPALAEEAVQVHVADQWDQQLF